MDETAKYFIWYIGVSCCNRHIDNNIISPELKTFVCSKNAFLNKEFFMSCKNGHSVKYIKQTSREEENKQMLQHYKKTASNKRRY